MTNICITAKFYFFNHTVFPCCRQEKKKRATAFAAAHGKLLSAEGLAVGALLVGGVHLVGAHLNTIQRTIIGGVAVIGTLLDSTGDTLVCVAIHNNSSFELGSDLV